MYHADDGLKISNRKICKNCLCPREEHEISEEPESKIAIPVGKLLFSPTADTLARGEKPYSPLRYVKQKGCESDQPLME